MGYHQTATTIAKCSVLDKDIDMIGPLFGAIGFVWGYLLARQRGGKRLDRLQYGAGFAIAFGLFGTLLGIALGRFLGAQ
jgi:hypothetical protein